MQHFDTTQEKFQQDLKVLYDQQLSAYKQLMGALIQEEKRRAGIIKGIEDGIQNAKQGQADFERNLRLQGMSDWKKYHAIRKEAAESRSNAEK